MEFVRLTVSPSLMSRSVAEDNDTDVVAFQVQGHTHDTARKFDHLTSLNVVQTVNAGDPVADAESTRPTSATSAS